MPDGTRSFITRSVIYAQQRRYYSMDKNKRLYRSDTNIVFAGICGGLGEYAEVDPVLIRLVWLLIVIFTGVVPGVVAYIIAIFIIPKKTAAVGASSSRKAESVAQPVSTSAYTPTQPVSSKSNTAPEHARTSP